MSEIRVAEIFYSLQGEGLYTGTPSLFMRVFGCNFKCRGFAMPYGELSDEYLKVDPAKYEKYEDLPLVHTGCDSYASWDARFKHLSQWMTIPQIVDKMQELLPDGKFGNVHLIITGGEPLLGFQKHYVELLNEIYNREMDHSHLTFETNGTQLLHDDLKTFLNENSYHYADLKETTFSISSKLPSSGEDWKIAINPEVVFDYLESGSNAYFKWVISSEQDWYDVQQAINVYGAGGVNIPVYLMPAGGTAEHYEKNKKWVAELAMRAGLRYSQRLQVDLWKNAWGT